MSILRDKADCFTTRSTELLAFRNGFFSLQDLLLCFFWRQCNGSGDFTWSCYRELYHILTHKIVNYIRYEPGSHINLDLG
jgi:hypothetical protein